MLHSLKQFRKRHFSTDPVTIASFPLNSCIKASATDEAIVKHTVARKDDVEVEAGDNDQGSISHALVPVSLDEEAGIREHPQEPIEVDNPICCPHPEPCILQDGRAITKLGVPSTKRRGQLQFLTESELQKLNWRRRSALSDGSIIPEPSLIIKVLQ